MAVISMMEVHNMSGVECISGGCYWSSCTSRQQIGVFLFSRFLICQQTAAFKY